MKLHTCTCRWLPLVKMLFGLLTIGSPAVLFIRRMPWVNWELHTEFVFYILPMYFLVFFWLSLKLDEKAFFQPTVFCVDMAAVGLSALRFWGLLYHSGHVLFLLYSFLTTSSKTYRVLCGGMILVTAYFKFVLWKDFITPGIAVIMVLGLVWLRKIRPIN